MKPETISKMLVNQMLLSFGTMFASQVGDAIIVKFSVWIFIADLGREN